MATATAEAAEQKTSLILKNSTDNTDSPINNGCDVCGGEGFCVERDEKGRVVCRDCQCGATNARRRAALMRAANLPLVTNAPKSEKTAKFVEIFNGSNWALFRGETGTGKTTQAVLVARALIERGVRTRFFNAGRLFRQLVASRRRQDEYETIFEQVEDVPLLILDDFLQVVPPENSFEYRDLKNAIFEVLGARLDANRATIITTRRSFRELAAFDDALASRIAERCASFVISTGRKENEGDKR